MRYVIIGNGITGISAAEVIRERDDRCQIVIISDESSHFYARTALMWIYMRQMGLRNLEPRERWWWEQQRLTLVQDRVTRIDSEEHRLQLRDGEPMDYDRLLLATGGAANMFGWPGQELDGVCNMCTLGDLRRLEAVRGRLQHAVVVGGGLIGVEMVEMMVHDHVPVTYLVREPWYWDMVLCEEEAELVHQRMRQHGVELVLEDEIGAIDGDARGRVSSLTTKKGATIPCQMVGVAVGVRSNTDLAEASGIVCDRGVLVDVSMATSAPGVFAAGDCAVVMRSGDAPSLAQKLWYTGIQQGRVAGRAMVGDKVRYDPGIPCNAAQFFFMDYLNVGWMKKAPFPLPPHLWAGVSAGDLDEHLHQAPGPRPDSIRISHLPGAGQVFGFSMLGSRWSAAVLMQWIEERRDLGWVLQHLDQAMFNEEFHRSRLAPSPGGGALA